MCAVPWISFQDAFPPLSRGGNVPDSLQREVEADGDSGRGVDRRRDIHRRGAYHDRRRVVVVAIVMRTPAIGGRPVRRIGERGARKTERGGGEEDLLQHGALQSVLAMLISRATPLKVNAESARAVTACILER